MSVSGWSERQEAFGEIYIHSSYIFPNSLCIEYIIRY